jgi:hypothetical protein
VHPIVARRLQDRKDNSCNCRVETRDAAAPAGIYVPFHEAGDVDSLTECTEPRVLNLPPPPRPTLERLDALLDHLKVLSERARLFYTRIQTTLVAHIPANVAHSALTQLATMRLQLEEMEPTVLDELLRIAEAEARLEREEPSS